MAAVTASHFVSNRSRSAYNGAFDSEPVKFQSFRIPYLSSRAAAHEGLRSRNVVDSLQMQQNSKASSEITTRGSRRSTRKPWAVVVCRSRMNLVFVGAEVAPWSKTGVSVMFLEDCHRPWRLMDTGS
ncbi:unnamed protein product [Musa hybrid cultivar]